MKNNKRITEKEVMGVLIETVTLMSELQAMEKDAEKVVEKMNNPKDLSDVLGNMALAMALGEKAETKLAKFQENMTIINAYNEQIETEKEENKDRVLVEKVCTDTVCTNDIIIEPSFESKTELGTNSKVTYKIRKERKGNKVICKIMTLDNRVLGLGIATCHEDDKFDDKVGATIAEYRARENWCRNSSASFMKRMNIQ